MQSRKLSIIIPAYNASKYITECLNSIIAQEYDNIEVIVVDDGSTDDTARIIKQFCDLDSRIHYIFKENGGVSSARNLGLEYVHGEFVTFVDSDDTIEKRMYSTMINCFDDPEIDVVCCGVNHIDSNGNIRERNNSIAKKIVSTDALSMTLIENGLNFSVYDKLFKTKLFNNDKKIRFPEGKTMEEAAILPLIYKRSNCLYHVGRCFYNYFSRPGSYVTKPLDENVFRIYDTIDSYRQNYIDDTGVRSSLLMFEYKNCIELYRRIILEKHKVKPQVYKVVKQRFKKIILPCLMSKQMSFKYKLMCIETYFHLHVLRKKGG